MEVAKKVTMKTLLEHALQPIQTADLSVLPVHYAFLDGSEIPAHVAAQNAMTIPFPHLAGNPHDKLQPLDDPCVGNIMADGKPDMQPCGASRINLIQDESKLWNPDKLWKQYEHNYKGCGNGKPYIVNDDTDTPRTR